MAPVKPRLRISLVRPTTYLVRLRTCTNRCIPPTIIGTKDIFVMQDIGQRPLPRVVQDYADNDLHVISMTPIPDWEGATQ